MPSRRVRRDVITGHDVDGAQRSSRAEALRRVGLRGWYRRRPTNTDNETTAAPVPRALTVERAGDRAPVTVRAVQQEGLMVSSFEWSSRAISLGVASALLLAAVAPAAAQPVPGYPDVVGEYLEVPGSRATDTPEALNRVTFLRLRHRALGESDEVDVVMIAQPGFASTPAAWLQLGSQLVTKAHLEACPVPGATDRRCALEVWVIDRRGSNLEDTEGLRRGWITQDPKRAVEYYYGLGVFTAKGTVRRPAGDNYDSLLGGTGTRFRPLTQRDLAFLWDWGFETAAGDVDALLALLP
jgi:hypothetical protein